MIGIRQAGVHGVGLDKAYEMSEDEMDLTSPHLLFSASVDSSSSTGESDVRFETESSPTVAARHMKMICLQFCSPPTYAPCRRRKVKLGRKEMCSDDEMEWKVFTVQKEQNFSASSQQHNLQATATGEQQNETGTSNSFSFSSGENSPPEMNLCWVICGGDLIIMSGNKDRSRRSTVRSKRRL